MKESWEVSCSCQMSSRHDVSGLDGPCSFDLLPWFSPHSQHEALAIPGWNPLAGKQASRQASKQASKQAGKQAASAREMLAANSCGQCHAFQLDNPSFAQSSPFWTSLSSTLPEPYPGPFGP